jgi:hypothetical protein
VTVVGGQNTPDNNFIEGQAASLGDKVWFDTDKDGIQDANENGVPGITVYLLDANGDRITDVNGTEIFTQTDSNGEYVFENLEPNKAYAVEFDLNTLPEAFSVTLEGEGTEANGSDADLTTGKTTPVTLSPGEHYADLDMGIKQDLFRIGTLFWIDSNQDGKFNPGEEPIPNALIELLDENGKPVIDQDGNPITTITDANGEYHFDVEVFDYVSVSFSGLDDEYCQFALPVIITGSQVPFGTFGGPGIIDNSNGTATFDPSVAGVGGPYNISYIYSEGGVCSSSYEKDVTVKVGEPVSFTGFNDYFCDENYNHVLTGSQAPRGYFTGDGITNLGDGTAFFNPSELGVGGPYLVVYNYEDDLGCLSSFQLETMVIDGPTADFSYDLGACNEDAAFIDLSSSPNGEITSWSWDFDDADSYPNHTSTEQNPLHTFVSNQSAFHIDFVVMDELGCSDSISKLIEPYSTTNIQGFVVSSSGQEITDGYVLAFLLSDGVISTQVDSVAIQDDGSFIFEGMASCVDYIFHAYANEDIYPDLIPRWHVDAFYWFDAAPVTVAWDDDFLDGIEINLYEVIPSEPGSSEIGGGVYYSGAKGEPVKNIDVVLDYEDPTEKADGVMRYQPTDELGQWTFTELPEGIFRIRIDIPGLTMDSIYTIEITQPNTVITGLNYYVDTNSGIFIDYTGIDEYDKLPFGSLSVFPNPNNGHFYLDIQKSERINSLNIQAVELWDMEGRLIKDFHISYQGERYLSNFNLDDVQPGMYFIKVKNNDEYGVKKFVIQR